MAISPEEIERIRFYQVEVREDLQHRLSTDGVTNGDNGQGGGKEVILCLGYRGSKGPRVLALVRQPLLDGAIDLTAPITVDPWRSGRRIIVPDPDQKLMDPRVEIFQQVVEEAETLPFAGDPPKPAVLSRVT